ncbi:MAG: hypothetical protein QMD23_02605 [Candidatus Bathyarchaeia archaeon]|nr:hypothetical protein [Candidatus Bathyarchaeia archaeon]
MNLVLYRSGKLAYDDTEAIRKMIDAIMVEEKRDYNYVLGSDEVVKASGMVPLVVVCTALTPYRKDLSQTVHNRQLKGQDYSKIQRRN